MVPFLHLPFSRTVAFSPLFVHLYFLPRLPGLEIESYGDLSIILFLGGEESRESESLKLSPNVSKPRLQALHILRESCRHIGSSQRKNMGLCPKSYTEILLCLDKSSNVCICVAEGCVCHLGGPSWLCAVGTALPVFLPKYLI